MTNIEKSTHAYIGRARCGCMVTAVRDDPDHPKRASKEVAKWIREGLTVERVLHTQVRLEFGCKHEQPPAQSADQLKMDI